MHMECGLHLLCSFHQRFGRQLVVAQIFADLTLHGSILQTHGQVKGQFNDSKNAIEGMHYSPLTRKASASAFSVLKLIVVHRMIQCRGVERHSGHGYGRLVPYKRRPVSNAQLSIIAAYKLGYC